MNQMTPFHQALTRFLLIGSFIIFAIGAAVPALDNVWGMSVEEGARWIATNPGRWAFSSISFTASLMLCVSGLAVFNEYFQVGEAQLLTKIGFYTFLIGALFWIMDRAFRLSIEPWAAQIFVETSSLPDSLTPLSLLESSISHIFMVSTFLASSIYGLALLKSPQFSNGLGWFAVGYGLLGALSDAIFGGPIPIMVLVVPLAIGMTSLPSSAPRKQCLL